MSRALLTGLGTGALLAASLFFVPARWLLALPAPSSESESGCPASLGELFPDPEGTVDTIAVGGDAMLGNWVELLTGLKAALGRQDTDPLDEIAPLFRRAELSVVNHEFVASSRRPSANLFGLRLFAGLESADRLKGAGIGAVSLANNHTGDLGPEGLTETLEALRARGVVPVGAGRTPEEAFSPRFFDLEQGRIAVLAFVDFPPNEALPPTSPVAVATASLNDPVPQREAPPRPNVPWEQAILRARSGADVVIVLPHWGLEFEPLPHLRQVMLARRMIDLGADLVLGAHPHVVQRAEVYRGKSIVYSLGNLVFALNELPGPVGQSTNGVVALARVKDRALLRLDLVPVAERLGSPFPISAHCANGYLLGQRRRALEWAAIGPPTPSR